MSTLDMSMTIYNNTTETFVLADYSGCNPPSNTIDSNSTGTVSASSSFDISGSVTYKSESQTASFTIKFSMPLVGDNSFSGSSDPDDTYDISIKNTSGYDASPDAYVTAA